MKTHIVRTTNTDRYAFTVPEKTSEITDDTHPYVIGSTFVHLTELTSSFTFRSDNSVLSALSGFASPLGVGSAPVVFVIPQSGVYLVSMTARWGSTTNAGGARVVTTNPYELYQQIGLLQAGINGTYGRDNQLGPLTSFPGDVPVKVPVANLYFFAAGATLTPAAFAKVMPEQLFAVMDFQLSRVA